MNLMRGLIVIAGLAAQVRPGTAAPMTFAGDIRPLLEKYCWDCHGDGMDKGGLALDAYGSEADLLKARKKWEGILFNIDNWLMPPVDKEQPTVEERKLLARWIDDTVFPVDPANPDPGRVTIRRLNKTEYNNTIRDLLGVTERPADTFPDDDSGYGFDNIGDVLAMPPVLVERYLAAAETVVEAAVVSSGPKLFTHEAGTEGSEVATRKILSGFASRAYRRPVRPAELDKLVALAARAQRDGETWEESVKVALKAALVSPYFLYRIEWQPDPNNAGKTAELSDFALASRLSYFLWSSMPDDRLLSLAFRNELRPNLAAEVGRMLADPKARELARNFGGQWLETRNLAIVQPNREKFGWDEELRDAMRGETEEFFHFLLTQNRSVLEFLSADYSFVNGRLARHYGMDGVEGPEFQKVRLDPSRRRGLLTQAAVLTVTSDPMRTSPVKRGKWVLENLLGTPPPPPPPNVPTLEGGPELQGTLRQRMEQHRANSACANCHAMLDPIGFGLENFDATGAWRDQDDGQPVESAGRLTSGQEFANAGELTTILLRDKSDQFVRTLASKLLTFALGRGVEYFDKPALREIMAKAKADNYAFHRLILAIAESVPFQKRRGDAAAE